jgi:phage tail sheath protein FI
VGVATAIDAPGASTLANAGVNAIRQLTGEGIVVWGARLLGARAHADPDWKYVNVRRLEIFLEHSIDEGTQWAVFEPNDEPLWLDVREAIDVFLYSLWRQGALAGRTPDEAYFVKCGLDTMTQDDIDNGLLSIVVGVAPFRPAEFVTFRIQRRIGDRP